VGVTGGKLNYALNDAAKSASHVTAAGVLGYGASQIGFTVSYSGLASDFTSMLPANTPRLPLFLCVYLGLFVPIICIQVFGAATRLAAFSIPAWDASAVIGAPNLIYTICGTSHAAKFVMVLLCLSTVANVAPTIYSCGLSGQVCLPFLIRVPRYFLALIVFAIFLPIAIVGSTHFFLVLENFLAVLGYWTALYLPPAILEPLIFRAPVNLVTYAAEIYNKPSKLPIGFGFIAGCIVVSVPKLRADSDNQNLTSLQGVPLCAAAMSQAWWNGWIARKIGGG
jgi:purine-cytosine permease-like protein